MKFKVKRPKIVKRIPPLNTQITMSCPCLNCGHFSGSECELGILDGLVLKGKKECESWVSSEKETHLG